MHPLVWIVWAGACTIAAVTTSNPFYLVVIGFAAWLVHATGGGDSPTQRSFHVFVMAGAIAVVLRTTLVVFGPVTVDRLAYAALEGLRLATILVVFGAFNAVADPFGVLRLAPRRLHEPALAAALALSIAPRTVAAVGRVREAQALRGISVHGLRTLPALAVPVLETGMEDAMVLAESMDARGHGRGRRSKYRATPWDLRSVLAVAVSLCAAGVFVAAGIAGAGDLVPPTMPLRVPDASLALVAAAAAFAVPGLLARRDR